VVAVDLADRGVHVHGQRPVTGTRAGHPCSAQQLAEHAVELADVPEGERSQPRPDRGGRHHAVAEDRAGRPGPQRLDVVDAIATGEQRVDQGEQLATGPGRARTITQINELVGELLDPEPLGQRRGQQQPRGGDGVIVIEGDVDGVENDVRGSHRKGVLRLGVNDWLATVILAGQGTLFIIQSRSTDHPIGGCRLSCNDSTQDNCVDAEHQAMDLAVGGSNPSRRAKAQLRAVEYREPAAAGGGGLGIAFRWPATAAALLMVDQSGRIGGSRPPRAFGGCPAPSWRRTRWAAWRAPSPSSSRSASRIASLSPWASAWARS
jgi:hypothetical protein